jgi:hypothetical protein
MPFVGHLPEMLVILLLGVLVLALVMRRVQ